MTTRKKKKTPTLTQAIERTIAGFDDNPRGDTLAEHVAATLQQALGKMQARSAVDVLTDNELAEAIADLK